MYRYFIGISEFGEFASAAIKQKGFFFNGIFISVKPVDTLYNVVSFLNGENEEYYKLEDTGKSKL